MRKIIDIHIYSSGWKLFLDSDMLFFKEPVEIINWLKNPIKPICMNDVVCSYGYDKNIMSNLANSKVPENINTGLFGFNSNYIDWDELEYWCKELIKIGGIHYYQEQALTAMLVSNYDYDFVPQSDYVIMPEKNEVISPKAVMHHYVAESKPWYYRYGWKHLI